jgi:hypothetical protein
MNDERLIFGGISNDLPVWTTVEIGKHMVERTTVGEVASRINTRRPNHPLSLLIPKMSSFHLFLLPKEFKDYMSRCSGIVSPLEFQIISRSTQDS